MSGHCVECDRENARRWYEENKERQLENARRWREENPKRSRECSRRWREENLERSREYDRRWSAENPDKVRAFASARRARELQATPPWADRDANLAVSTEAVRLERKTGVAHHVDHIVPLRCKDRATGKRIACGLHVPWNLAPMPGPENLSKGHRVDRDLLDADQLAFSRQCALSFARAHHHGASDIGSAKAA